jgi:hypothetical protein
MPQKIKMKKADMESGEMTGKMRPKREMEQRRERIHQSLEMKGKPLTKAEAAKGEMDYMKLKEEDARLNKPTSTKRVVGVVMKGKMVNPSATKMAMKSIAEKVAKARAAKGVQDEKYRK